MSIKNEINIYLVTSNLGPSLNELDVWNEHLTIWRQVSEVFNNYEVIVPSSDYYGEFKMNFCIDASEGYQDIEC